MPDRYMVLTFSFFKLFFDSFLKDGTACAIQESN